MKFVVSVISMFFSIITLAQSIEIKNANWFDGSTFRKGILYVEDGFFKATKPVHIQNSIDVTGKYIIPPLAEAHTHNLLSSYDIDQMINMYLDQGIFYIQVLGGSHKGRQAVAHKVKESILEVTYSNGGITSTLGHPFRIAEPLAMGIHNPKEQKQKLNEIRKSRIAENDAYWFYDSINDVALKWEELLATKPDFIKIMLLDVAHYKTLRKDSLSMGKKGISQEVAKYIIQKSKNESLRVFAHIESVKDFEIAAELGVDVIAHLPDYAWSGNMNSDTDTTLSKEVLKLAQERNIAVIATTSLSKRYLTEYVNGTAQIESKKLKRLIESQKKLLDYMLSHDIIVALGSDQYQKSLWTEIEHINKNNILDPSVLLNIITKVNSQLIFPNRKVGEIKDGYEASFLVLDKNPMIDINSILQIDSSYKNGVLIKTSSN